MEPFSNSDKFDMLSCYILSHKNSTRAAELYLNHYPERRQPHLSTYRNLRVNLIEHGSFIKPYKNPQRISEETKTTVLQAIVENPNTSTREIQRNTGIPKSTAHKILASHKYHPYKYNVCQSLRPGDNERRREFCEWYTRQCDANDNFPSQILWSDESNFTNNGLFNRQNLRYWSTENPHVLRPARNQVRFGFNVWCGILGSQLIGPIIFNGTLTSDVYLNLLQNNVEDFLDEIPLAEAHNCWFHQDGAPAHNSRIVMNYLTQRFGNRWIGTRGPIAWPPRSPDLTPLDFFLWGYIKDKVYVRTYDNVDELRERVIQAFRDIPRRILHKAVQSTIRRSYLCLENNGQVFEHLL